MKSCLLVLSGPSGVGKDSVVHYLKQGGYPLHLVVTATTRPHRPQEKEAVDYHFLSPQEFQQMREHGELVEWAQVYGHWYGVPRAAIQEALSRGDALVKVDVQGAATLKKLFPQAVLIFLAPPGMEELAHRLRRRHTESPQELARRLEVATQEMQQQGLFDYVVVNHQVEKAVERILAILRAENARPCLSSRTPEVVKQPSSVILRPDKIGTKNLGDSFVVPINRDSSE